MEAREAILSGIIQSYEALYAIGKRNVIARNRPITPEILRKKVNFKIGKVNPNYGHLICMVAAKHRTETLQYLQSNNFTEIDCRGVQTAISTTFPVLMYDEHRLFGKTFPEMFRYFIIIARWERSTWATIAVNKFDNAAK